MTWVPVQGHHAIERMRVEIVFSEQLPSRVVEAAKRAFEQVRGNVRFSEPVPQEIHQFQLQPGALQPVAQKFGGWQSTRESSPASVVEAISVNVNGLSYEVTDYRGWNVALRRFNSVCAVMIKQFSEVVDLNSFGIEYVNRFVYQGAPSAAAPGEVIDAHLLATVSEGVRSGRYLWHLHRGWFDRVSGRSMLINQNIDAQDGKTLTGSDLRSVQIYTKAEFRPEPEQFKVDHVDEIAVQLHDISKATFSSALTGSARKMIGFDGGD